MQRAWGIDPATLRPMTAEQLAALAALPEKPCCGQGAAAVTFTSPPEK